MADSDHSAPPIVPALEQTGALLSLLVHDLANHLCVISGNATYAELIANDPVRVATALQAISQASEVAGDLLGRCAELRKLVARAIGPGDVAAALDLLRRLYGSHPGWRLEIAPDLTGTLAVEEKWIGLAVERIIAQLQAGGGTLRVGLAAPVPDTATGPCLEIGIRAESSRPFSLKQARETYDNPGLLAAFEVIRGRGGRLEPGPGDGTAQEVILRVPLTPPPPE
jgi:hypothetical protein